MLNDEMEREWRAWRNVCERLKLLGIDINTQDELAEALRYWGRRLVELREHQAEHGVTS